MDEDDVPVMVWVAIVVIILVDRIYWVGSTAYDWWLKNSFEFVK